MISVSFAECEGRNSIERRFSRTKKSLGPLELVGAWSWQQAGNGDPADFRTGDDHAHMLARCQQLAGTIAA